MRTPLYNLFRNRIVFSMRVLGFLASGILEERLRGLFSYEFTSFFGTELFFSMRLFVFLASGILEDGSVAFFHMNL